MSERERERERESQGQRLNKISKVAELLTQILVMNFQSQLFHTKFRCQSTNVNVYN
jgi:hypothetical protein